LSRAIRVCANRNTRDSRLELEKGEKLIMELHFATTNPHKALELQQLLTPAGVCLRVASELAMNAPEPVEDADTFEGNAQLKARAYARAIGKACLADDSGLEVTALHGAPGVHSARYAGTGETRTQRDAANRNKLLAELDALGDVERTAQLVCVLCLADENGRVLFSARGAVSALIAKAPRGDQGFGYDSLLWLPELGKTIAELTPLEWNAISHRAAAARSLAAYLGHQ
jgi:XTP/dITP diphosphohydrolase